MSTIEPYIPEYITVHLGPPSSNAANVTVAFPDYIKNVASSEIYPTWNESAIRANIYAQISFALNRVFLEYYRSRGYNFNITNSTAFDQNFENGRNIFENISRIVDEIFTDYIRREGKVEPLAAKYCNGTTVTCDGLSQWGSEYLARDGFTPIEILENYYGNDIELVRNAPISGVKSLYPGYPLRFGDSGNSVKLVQSVLNRISQDYPSIPKLYPVDGIFGKNTEAAVKKFQSIFGLASDGIVGRATWNKLEYVYVGIKKLSELESEGIVLFGKSLEYPDAIKEGDVGEKVTILQYFLAIISEFNDMIPSVEVTGTFGPETKNSVLEFQKLNNLPQTGVVDDSTWDVLYNTFIGITNTVFSSGRTNTIEAAPYGGVVLKLGSVSESVKVLQQYLNVISNVYSEISPVAVTGIYNKATESSVLEFQKRFSLEETGEVDRNVWNAIANEYKNVVSASTTRPTQYPGYVMKLGDKD